MPPSGPRERRSSALVIRRRTAAVLPFHAEKSVVRMSDSPFLEDLPLLTAQQREQVRAAFQVALVESPLPTVLTNLEGRILGTNALVEELFGAEEAELHGRRIIEFVAEEDRYLTAGVIDRLATGKT